MLKKSDLKKSPRYYDSMNLHWNSGIASNINELLFEEQLLNTSRFSQKLYSVNIRSLSQSFIVMFSERQSGSGHWNCKTSGTSEVALKVIVGVR